MKCPKYIFKALLSRAKHAALLIDRDLQIAEWLEKNNIEVASEDICGGVEIYVNPYESARRIYQAILEKEI